MMYSYMIVDITISRGSFVFSQSRVQVSASLTNVGSLAVGAFDLVNCSIYYISYFPQFNLSFEKKYLFPKMPQNNPKTVVNEVSREI